MANHSESTGRSYHDTQTDTSGSLADLFNSVFKDEEFESEYEKDRIYSVAELIDLVREYAEGKISPTTAYIRSKEIQRHDFHKSSLSESKLRLLSCNIYQYRENVEFLLKMRCKSLDAYYSAIVQCEFTSPFILAQDFEVLEYFVKNPLSSFASASKALSVHPTTISTKFRRLQSLNYFMVTGYPNRWLFGLRTFFLFFALNSNGDRFQIGRDMASFPYFYVLNEARADSYYARFVLPNDENIISQFSESISRYSESNLVSWRLDELQGAECVPWTNNVTKRGYSLPRIFLENEFPPPLSNSYLPRMFKTRNDPELTFRDFVVLSALAHDLLISAKALSKTSQALAYNISEKEAYYRKTKLLKKEAIIPWPRWIDEVAHTLRLDARCDKEASYSLLSAAFECTPFIYSLTSEGIQLWLHIPISHLSAYTSYFKSLLTNRGIDEYNFALSKNWSGAPLLMDLVENWNYGPKGFTTEGLNLSADIFDYI